LPLSSDFFPSAFGFVSTLFSNFFSYFILSSFGFSYAFYYFKFDLFSLFSLPSFFSASFFISSGFFTSAGAAGVG